MTPTTPSPVQLPQWETKGEQKLNSGPLPSMTKETFYVLLCVGGGEGGCVEKEGEV